MEVFWIQRNASGSVRPILVVQRHKIHRHQPKPVGDQRGKDFDIDVHRPVILMRKKSMIQKT